MFSLIRRARLISAGTLLFCLSPLAIAARVPTPDPSQGDGRVSAFYTWEQQIPDQPGKLLRSEPLPAELGLNDASRQLRILYTSTDGLDGKSVNTVSGALFIPKGTAPKGGWPVLTWAHGTVGLADICAPSWAGNIHRVRQYLNTWLREGFAVVATDYQGLGTPGPHPLINVPALSYNVLDAAKAVIGGVPELANTVVIAGQSQGGAAAFGAAAHAPTYAPTLGVKGSIGTGVIYQRGSDQPPLPGSTLPSDPRAVDPALAYSILGFVVAQQLDPSLEPGDLFTDKVEPLLEQARGGCLVNLMNDVTTAGLTREQAFKAKPGERYEQFLAGAAERTRRYSLYPTLKLKQPILIGTGASDRTPAAVNQLALMRDACAAGSVVESHLFAGLGHSEAVPASLKHAIPFARKVISGAPVTPVCAPVLE